MNYIIPDEPFIFPHKENNHSLNLIAPKEKLKIQEKDNNSNLIPSTEVKFIQNKENTNENIKEEEVNNTFSSKKTQNNNKNKNKNKFDDNNIRRKCKHILLSTILDFINERIKDCYKNNIGQGIFIKQLQSLNGIQKSEPNIKFNQDFLKQKLKDIFSDDISGKITKFPKDFNKKLIEYLLNEKDITIKDYFTNLFNLTFSQCLEHYRGTNFYYELNGIKSLKKEIMNYMEDEEYVAAIEYYFQNYEKIINNKKSRNSNKKGQK